MDNWFQQKNVIKINAGPNVLRKTTYNFWSMMGHTASLVQGSRHFFINHNYGGCNVDNGLIVVVDKPDACKNTWVGGDKKPLGNKSPRFLYTRTNGCKWSDKNCVKEADTFTISVLEGHPCDANQGKGPCSHTCKNNGKNPVCSCPSGLKLGADKRTCSKPHPCDVNNGGCNHICRKDKNNAVCACRAGHALLSNKKTCTKIAAGYSKKGDGYYYKYYTGAKNWNAALGVCRSQGGTLAIIWNDTTSKIVHNTMRPGRHHGWIGGTDQRREGKWITPKDVPWDSRWSNRALPWTNWNNKEPNNAGRGGEDCLHQLNTRKWNDLPCNLKNPFICQIKYWS